MNYVKITDDRYDDVIKYLRYTFFVDEPLNKAMELCKPGEKHAESEKYALKTMEEGLSIVAVSEDNEVRCFEFNRFSSLSLSPSNFITFTVNNFFSTNILQRYN